MEQLKSLELLQLILLISKKLFKPGAHGQKPHVPGFLKLLCSCVGMCVCLPQRPLITSSVMLCDIDRVRLVKQVSRLFPAFNYFIMTLAIDKMYGRDHIDTARPERLPKKTKVTQY